MNEDLLIGTKSERESFLGFMSEKTLEKLHQSRVRRLETLQGLNAPEIMIRREKQMIEESSEALNKRKLTEKS
jgi:hypothetical protein